MITSDCYLAVILIVLGAAITLSPVVTALFWLRTKNWPRVSARIVASSLEERRNPVGAGVVIYEYRPRVKYEYEIMGRRYSAQRLGVRDRKLWTHRREDAESALFAPGDEIEVHVSPKNSASSIIDPNVSFQDFYFLSVFLILGILIGGVGIYVYGIACQSL